MSKISDLDPKVLHRMRGALEHEWWLRAAYHAACLDAVETLTTDDGVPYLYRFWLAPALKKDDGRLESANSLLLHHILRPDSGPPHCHPWSFESTVLSGGYEEREFRLVDGLDSKVMAQTAVNFRLPLKTPKLYREEEIHCITSVDRDTWTLVRTHRRCRTWGFYPDGKFVAYDEYFKRRGEQR